MTSELSNNMVSSYRKLLEIKKHIKTLDGQERSEAIAELILLQKQMLDDLRRYKEDIKRLIDNHNDKLINLRANSVFSSLPLGMEAGQNLNSIIKSGSKVFSVRASLRNTDPRIIESLFQIRKTTEQMQQSYNSMQRRIVDQEKFHQNIIKSLENMKKIKRSKDAAPRTDARCETMCSENCSISTICGEDILASSSAIETELRYQSSSEE